MGAVNDLEVIDRTHGPTSQSSCDLVYRKMRQNFDTKLFEEVKYIKNIVEFEKKSRVYRWRSNNPSLKMGAKSNSRCPSYNKVHVSS